MAHEVKNESKHKDTGESKKGAARPPGASDKAVISELGVTEPTIEFGGDGVTPLDEFNERMKPLREAQAKKDKERREKAVEEAGVLTMPEKGKEKHGKTNSNPV